MVLVAAFLGGCLWLLEDAAIFGLLSPAPATRLETIGGLLALAALGVSLAILDHEVLKHPAQLAVHLAALWGLLRATTEIPIRWYGPSLAGTKAMGGPVAARTQSPDLHAAIAARRTFSDRVDSGQKEDLARGFRNRFLKEAERVPGSSRAGYNWRLRNISRSSSRR